MARSCDASSPTIKSCRTNVRICDGVQQIYVRVARSRGKRDGGGRKVQLVNEFKWSGIEQIMQVSKSQWLIAEISSM